jgi:hypothetical protein
MLGTSTALYGESGRLSLGRRESVLISPARVSTRSSEGARAAARPGEDVGSDARGDAVGPWGSGDFAPKNRAPLRGRSSAQPRKKRSRLGGDGRSDGGAEDAHAPGVVGSGEVDRARRAKRAEIGKPPTVRHIRVVGVRERARRDPATRRLVPERSPPLGWLRRVDRLEKRLAVRRRYVRVEPRRKLRRRRTKCHAGPCFCVADGLDVLLRRSARREEDQGDRKGHAHRERATRSPASCRHSASRSSSGRTGARVARANRGRRPRWPPRRTSARDPGGT